MPDLAELRSDIEEAETGLREAERDVSQTSSLLSDLREAYEATEASDEGRVDELFADLRTTVGDWDYGPEDLTTDDVLERLGIETVEDLETVIPELSEGQRLAEWESLSAFLSSVVAADESLADLGPVLDELDEAFGDPEADVATFAGELGEGLAANDVTTAAELRATAAGVPGGLDALRYVVESTDEAVTELEEAFGGPDAAAFEAALGRFATVVRTVDAIADARRERVRSLTASLVEHYPEDLEQVHEGLDADVPVLLLPVRLETKFRTTPDADHDRELRVRVYPDDVHVDTHERELTAEEVRWGVHFWEQLWWACHRGNAEQLRDALSKDILDSAPQSLLEMDPEPRYEAVKERAWNQLEERFGPERAAWVKRELAPTDSATLLDGPLDSVPSVDFDALRANAERRPESWTRAPEASALPDRWVAFAETDGGVVTGTSGPVRTPLSIGPDPDRLASVETEPAASEDLADGEMDWVFDFDAALDAGMGLTLPLSDAQVDAGIDRLVVVGVTTASDATGSAAKLRDLFEAHRHTEGLSFLPRGTPTNNVSDERSGEPPGESRSAFEVECSPAGLPTDSDGAVAARLLGLPADTFGRVPNAGLTSERDARAMNAALWSATWGYAVPHMLAPARWLDVPETLQDHSGAYGEILDAIDERIRMLSWLDAYREHFVEYVRAGGPLPTLRVGEQPYGVVPTMGLDEWTARESEPEPKEEFFERLPDRTGEVEADLVERLQFIRPLWENAGGRIPSVETETTPWATLVELLGMDAAAFDYRVPGLLGATGANELTDEDYTSTFEARSPAITDTLRTAAPSADVPRIAHLLFTADAATSVEPLVDGGTPEYVDALLDASVGSLQYGASGYPFRFALGFAVWSRIGVPGELVELATSDASLLKTLLYFALCGEYRLALVRLSHLYRNLDARLEEGMHWSATPYSLIPEPEQYDRGDETLWSLLGSSVPAEMTEHPEIAEGDNFVEALQTVPELDRSYAGYRDALRTLRDADEADLERLLRETLDLAGHRYDAWETSVASRRLDDLRETVDGLHVGAYGYVENLTTESGRDSVGYVHAPSVGQANTAAVLRSGFEARQNRLGEMLAVDLSARRVREARRLIAAVRNGRSLGAVLGYRFERALHENHPDVNLDQYVHDFRAVAPLVEGKVVGDGIDESESAARQQVVDGVALNRKWREDAIPWGSSGDGTQLPREPGEGEDPGPAYAAIQEELRSLDETFDAVSDVLVAESVHQLVNGNPTRAGGSLDALSRGEPVPDPEVTETPRSGTSATHRLLVLFDGGTEDETTPTTPRAEAEPTLDDWASELFGDFDRVCCRAEYDAVVEDGDDGDGETDGPPTERAATVVRLSELALAPMDLLALVEGDDDAWQSELEGRVEYLLRRTAPNVAPEPGLLLTFGLFDAWPDAEALGIDPETDVPFGELLEVARAARELGTAARPLAPEDLGHPDEPAPETADDSKLTKRAADAMGRLEEVDDTLDTVVTAFEREVRDEAERDDPDEAVDREVEDLRAVVAALDDLDARDVAALRERIENLDVEKAVTGLAAFTAAATGIRLATTESGEIQLRQEAGQEIRGRTAHDPGATIRVRIHSRSGSGQPFLQTRNVSVRDDGTFVATFDLSDLAEGTPFEVFAVGPDGRPARAGGTVVADPADHELQWELHEEARELVTINEELAATTADPLPAVVAALDRQPLSAAGTAVAEAGHWPDEDAHSQFENLLAIADLALPGVGETSEQWRSLVRVLSVLADTETVSESLLEAAELTELHVRPAREEYVESLGSILDDFVAALTALETAVAVGNAATTFVEGALETLREELVEAANYGIHGAIPLSATGATDEDVETLVGQATSVREEATERVDAAKEAVPKFDDQPTDDQPSETQPTDEQELARLEALFGDSFVALPPFQFPTEADATLASAHSKALQNGDELASETWFQRVARVRDKPRQLGRVLTYGETFGEASQSDARFRVGQFPHRPTDRWVGLPEAKESRIPAGRCSVVAHVASQPGDLVAGLFVDEWVETVPSESETTGLTFHYDKPGNRAPQTMLVGVPPDGDGWSVRDLRDTVVEGVELGKLRLVDREALDRAGHLLPALTVARNVGNWRVPDTGSVDLDALGLLHPEGGES